MNEKMGQHNANLQPLLHTFSQKQAFRRPRKAVSETPLLCLKEILAWRLAKEKFHMKPKTCATHECSHQIFKSPVLKETHSQVRVGKSAIHGA